MKKLKLMTIVGTRPEIIRLAAIIKLADQYFDHILVHTGQNYDYELNEIFFKEFQLRKPDYCLNTVGKNLGETMGNIISASYDLIKEVQPDAILILGDTNSALSAISAKRLKCPIFHFEAGNRCWDWNVSEMINRTIVDHISDINIAYTETARRNLIQEGIDPKSIFVVGSPMKEVLKLQLPNILKSNVLEKLGLEKGKYFLLSIQREENVDNHEKFLKLIETINEVAKQYQYPIIFSVHPRTRKKIEIEKITFDSHVQLFKPFGINDYCQLELNAFCVLSDSGTLSEESSLLKIPAVLLRTSTERPEVLDKGNLVMGGIEKDNVLNSIEMAIHQDMLSNEIPSEYDVDQVALRIIKIIQSYIQVVNLTTWKKNK